MKSLVQVMFIAVEILTNFHLMKIIIVNPDAVLDKFFPYLFTVDTFYNQTT